MAFNYYTLIYDATNWGVIQIKLAINLINL
jgi:hypothetical protein